MRTAAAEQAAEEQAARRAVAAAVAAAAAVATTLEAGIIEIVGMSSVAETTAAAAAAAAVGVCDVTISVVDLHVGEVLRHHEAEAGAHHPPGGDEARRLEVGRREGEARHRHRGGACHLAGGAHRPTTAAATSAMAMRRGSMLEGLSRCL